MNVRMHVHADIHAHVPATYLHVYINSHLYIHITHASKYTIYVRIMYIHNIHAHM